MGYGDNKHNMLWRPELEHAKKILQDPSLRAEVKVKFKKRKWLFRAITLCLLILITIVIVKKGTPVNEDWLIPFVLIIFFIFYSIAGAIIFRCPACNFGLSFSKTIAVPTFGGLVIPTGDKKNDWSNKLSCPRCRNQLS